MRTRVMQPKNEKEGWKMIQPSTREDKVLKIYHVVDNIYGMVCPICGKVVGDGEPVLGILYKECEDETPIYMDVCFDCGQRKDIRQLIGKIK